MVLVLLSGCLSCFFSVSGVGILYGHLALQNSTFLWHHVCCPLSLSLCLSFAWDVRRRRCPFSPSGAGETQTFLGVWGSPCVFFVSAVLMHLDPYFVVDACTTAMPSPFFSRRCRSSFWLECFSVCTECVGFLVVSLVLVCRRLHHSHAQPLFFLVGVARLSG